MGDLCGGVATKIGRQRARSAASANFDPAIFVGLKGQSASALNADFSVQAAYNVVNEGAFDSGNRANKIRYSA
jgi:hypothetical protein